MDACRACGAPLETPLGCTACGVLAPGEAPRSPFDVLGLAEQHAVDACELRRRLLRFSRLVHPDYFAAAGPEERARAERAAAALNDAHEVLADEASRADWLVTAWGGPSEREERAMPAEFLHEVLEWNEALEGARASAPGSPERAALAPIAADLEARRAAALAELARELAPAPRHDRAALARARRTLNALRYLERALSEIRELGLAEPTRR